MSSALITVAIFMIIIIALWFKNPPIYMVAGVKKLPAAALWDYLKLEQRGENTRSAGRQLKIMGIDKKFDGKDYFYMIDTFELDKVAELA